MAETLSANDPFPRTQVPVGDSTIAYIDIGQGAPILFLHGNPTSSYLWRNVIPHVQHLGRVLAPDLVGHGASGKSPRKAYRYADHIAYLDEWFDKVLGDQGDIILVGHDWGGAVGMYRACRYPDRFVGVAYMEMMVRPRFITDFPEHRRADFQRMRGPDGDAMVLDQNFFVETMLFEKGIIRDLSDAEKSVYRNPTDTRDSRLPGLTMVRDIPLDGEPADNHKLVKRYSDWLGTSSIPKLFMNTTEGHGLAGAARDHCRQWTNQTEVMITGRHYAQEDSPHEIGVALAAFIERVRGG